MSYIPPGKFNLLAYATVKITTEIGSGTGFFYGEKIDENSLIMFLITNKHVFASASSAKFFVHMEDIGAGKPKPNTYRSITLALQYKIEHPDPNIDLVAFNVSPFFEEAKKRNEKIFSRAVGKKSIPTQTELEEFSIAEEVCMIGYPIGLEDSLNHYPIVRKGITATHPIIDYNGKKEFMIDMACLPGSSGSPVFIINENSYRTGNNINIGSRMLFLGVLWGGPQQDHIGEFIPMNIPVKPMISTPAHLGFVIKSSVVKEFIEYIVQNKLYC